MASSSQVVIDNSTLSGVERLIGRSQTFNLYNTHNDIACFEKLITAILFYDDVFAVNDYKKEYIRKRLETFNYISFLDVRDEEYIEISSDAAQFASSMMFSFEGSEPAGDVVAFFETLRIHPQMRWDIFTSSEYLTLSFLVNNTRNSHYEGRISAAFGNELGDRSNVAPEADVVPQLRVGDTAISDIKELVHRFQAGNSNSSGRGHRDTLEKLIFGYGWAAERSRFYSAIAAQRDMEIALSPLRDAFCESCCRIDTPHQVMKLLENMKASTSDALHAILMPSGEGKFAFKLPFFTSFFISRADTASIAIEMALNYRDRSEFKTCRDLLFNLRHSDKANRYVEVNAIFKFLNQALSDMLKKYSVAEAQEPAVSFSLGITGPSVSYEAKIGRLFREYRNRPFAKVFRSMAQDILNIERMGALYDKMLLQVREHADARHSRPSVTPLYMRDKESAHGKPALPGQ